MKYYYILIIFFFNLFLNSFFINSLVVLPFSFINKKTNILLQNPIPTEYFEYYLNGAIYTTIKTNNKPLQSHLTLDRYTTYISEKILQEIAPKSAEINKDEDLYSLEYIGIYRAKYTNTSFSFLSNDNQNISFNTYSFFMMIKFTDDFDYVKRTKYYATEDVEIGFNVFKGNKVEKVAVEEEEEIDPYDQGDDDEDEPEGEKYVYKNNGYLLEENTNLISQLKKDNLTISCAFIIKYEDEKKDNGKIIIGGKPHEYDPRHYKDTYFIRYYTNTNVFFSNWGINLQDILYNEIKYPSMKAVEITIDFAFILATESFLVFLNENFFEIDNNNEHCYQETVNNYIVIYCEESIIKNFKNISFVLPRDKNLEGEIHEFIFDYKDLFIKLPGNTNYYCFQIVFQNGYYNWKLGLPLFKKYHIIFDRENKIFGFYNETGEYEYENDSDNDSNSSQKKFPVSWIIVIILSLLLIGLGIAFYLIFPKIRRKKKANEMDDDYEYTSQVDNANKIN